MVQFLHLMNAKIALLINTSGASPVAQVGGNEDDRRSFVRVSLALERIWPVAWEKMKAFLRCSGRPSGRGGLGEIKSFFLEC
jgi:hypothetical protein